MFYDRLESIDLSVRQLCLDPFLQVDAISGKRYVLLLQHHVHFCVNLPVIVELHVTLKDLRHNLQSSPFSIYIYCMSR